MSWKSMPVLVAVIFMAVAGNARAQEIRSMMVTHRGEVTRAELASDGAPDTGASIAVRGPDATPLSNALFGFEEGEENDWTLHFDAQSNVTGPVGNVGYNIEVSTDGGRTFNSVRKEAAGFRRTEMTFEVGRHLPQDVRARLTLYLVKDGDSAGSMGVFEVYLKAESERQVVLPHVADTRGETSKGELAADGAPDTAANIAVRGPDGPLISFLLFGFQSEEEADWQLDLDMQVNSSGTVHQVAYRVEMSTDGGRTFNTLKNDQARLKRTQLEFEVGEVKASDVRVKIMMYFVKTDAAAGSMGLFGVQLSRTGG